jgi:hypothetical protein
MFKDDAPIYRRQMTVGNFKPASTPWDRVNFVPEPTIAQAVAPSSLDGDHATSMHDRLIDHYRREVIRQEAHRAEMARDFDFYDGIQLSEEMVAHLEERGQTPLVFNVIANVVNWMLGTERRARTDYRILPREEGASKNAEKKTQLLKYLSDVNRSPFGWSRAFADACKGGVGWIEDGVQEEDEGEPIYSRYESWRNIIWDSAATELDLSDARYIFRAKWTDVDTAIAMFPDRAAQIRHSSTTSLAMTRALDMMGDLPMDQHEIEMSQQSYSTDVSGIHQRERVRLIEAWYRTPVEDQYMQGGQFSGELYDSQSEGHVSDILYGRAQVVKKRRMRVQVAIMTEEHMLFMGKSPYRHNRYPFTPIWCYRRDRDNLPYGLIRQMRDPQIDINNRASKALHILNSNKVVMDEGAVADLEQFEQEVSRPDAIIVKKPGKELILDADRGMDQAHLELMSRSISLIQSMTGVTDENMGRTTNATSGKAIIARQDQGSLATAPIFDNLRFARQVSGEKAVSLIEQYMTEVRQFRITNMRGNPQYIQINDGLPENDIAMTKADFIITEDDFAATIRQAQVEELMALVAQMGSTSPEMVFAILDLVVEIMDIPQREEIVRRIRQITGQTDPDEDPNNPEPETIARQQAQEEEAQFQKAMAMAELEKKQGEAKRVMAEAEKASAAAREITARIRQIIAATEGESVETQVRALEAASRLLQAPVLGSMADVVLDSAGYQDRTALAMAGKMPSAPMQPQPPGQQVQPSQTLPQNA